MCKDRNQALSWYKGKRYYHGVWGSPEADRNYKRFLTKLIEYPGLPLQVEGTGEVLVSELTARFLKYVESRNKGKTYEGHFKRAIGFLVETYGEFVLVIWVGTEAISWLLLVIFSSLTWKFNS